MGACGVSPRSANKFSVPTAPTAGGPEAGGTEGHDGVPGPKYDCPLFCPAPPKASQDELFGEDASRLVVGAHVDGTAVMGGFCAGGDLAKLGEPLLASLSLVKPPPRTFKRSSCFKASGLSDAGGALAAGTDPAAGIGANAESKASQCSLGDEGFSGVLLFSGDLLFTAGAVSCTVSQKLPRSAGAAFCTAGGEMAEP